MPLIGGIGTPQTHAYGVDFFMVTRLGVSIRCTVTLGALLKLAKDPYTGRLGDQLSTFNEWREGIEGIASQKYDTGTLDAGVVVVRPEDVMAAGLVSASAAKRGC